MRWGMARHARIAPGGYVYHVLNRGNGGREIFGHEEDFGAFEELLEQGRQRTGMRILGWCLMPNHWHLVLWPRRDGDLTAFVGWVSNTHVRRWRAHRRAEGEGHLYQGRYKNFIVQSDEHLHTVLHYVEQNPLRGGLVRQSRRWRWSSASPQACLQADPWPIERPKGWLRILDRMLPEAVLERVRASVKRGRPYGSPRWETGVVRRLGLEHTVRDPWRPRRSHAACGPGYKSGL